MKYTVALVQRNWFVEGIQLHDKGVLGNITVKNVIFNIQAALFKHKVICDVRNFLNSFAFVILFFLALSLCVFVFLLICVSVIHENILMVFVLLYICDIHTCCVFSAVKLS